MKNEIGISDEWNRSRNETECTRIGDERNWMTAEIIGEEIEEIVGGG